MSKEGGLFERFGRRMSKHIMDGPIGDLDGAYRRSIGLEETISEARGIARRLPPADSEKILKAIAELDEKAGKSDTKASVYFWVGVGIAIGSLVVSFFMSNC
ncbi:hypothetical protein NGM33_28830 [Nocardiopsis dassonvillei]|uniref:hypothetical protein n=1 Tax=Nocardiopsis dassonvillei TaxID=2014 RepID=UPI0020A4A146|nr:hypothetical protein [Nocardiopsis dassonvillei]MCP3017343.1 hypothetical protein [Nocardiopsis dassonvillei]